jgi:hypothetical protein
MIEEFSYAHAGEKLGDVAPARLARRRPKLSEIAARRIFFTTASARLLSVGWRMVVSGVYETPGHRACESQSSLTRRMENAKPLVDSPLPIDCITGHEA